MILHPEAHDYQNRGVEFSLDKKGVYWMVDMGLGKTLMALMMKQNRPEPFLTVGPLRPLYSTWPNEVAKWYPDMKVGMLHGTDKDYNFLQPADMYLINPEGWTWLERKAKRLVLPFKHLVIDEGSMWKAHDTKRFKLLRKMRHLFKSYTILSGTPSPQSLMDLWSQYYILDGGERLGPSIGNYRSKYFDLHIVNNQFPKYTPKDGAFDEIMAKVADITFRLDADDYLKLPPCVFNEITLPLPPGLMERYKAFEEDFVLEHGDLDVEAFNEASLNMKLRQFIQGGIYTGDPDERPRRWDVIHNIRTKALIDLMEETGQPILCAIQFRFELEMIRQALGYKVPYIGGGTSPKEGARLEAEWNRKEIPLLLCHPRSLMYGANLQTGGNIILWYALTWSLEQYLQLIKRLDRQGQLDTVIVHHFVTPGTVDVKVSKALIRKENVQQAVLDYFRERSK